MPSTGPMQNDMQILTHAGGEAATDLLIAVAPDRAARSMAASDAARC